ncbi:MAG: hypothetical protein P1U50_00970 [Parvibaculaceae bacterium]|nr:hypothetical protein [Parvibaculaceae bacterium]
MSYATTPNDPRPPRPLTRDQAQAALNLREEQEVLDKARSLCNQLKELAGASLSDDCQSTVSDYLDDMMDETFGAFQGDLS